MEVLEKLLSLPPSEKAWDEICDYLNAIEDDDALMEMVEVCEVGLKDWPDGLRVAIENWNDSPRITRINSALARLTENFDFPSDRIFLSDDSPGIGHRTHIRPKRKILAANYFSGDRVLCRAYLAEDIYLTLSPQHGNSTKQILITPFETGHIFDAFISHCLQGTFVFGYSAKINAEGFIFLYLIIDNCISQSHRVKVPMDSLASTHDQKRRSICTIDPTLLAAFIFIPTGKILKVALEDGSRFFTDIPSSSVSDLKVFLDKLLIVREDGSFHWLRTTDLVDCESSKLNTSELLTVHFRDGLRFEGDEEFLLYPFHEWIALWRESEGESHWELQSWRMFWPPRSEPRLQAPIIRVFEPEISGVVLYEDYPLPRIRTLEFPANIESVLMLAPTQLNTFKLVVATALAHIWICMDDGTILAWIDPKSGAKAID